MSQYRRYPRTPRSRSSANSFPVPAVMTQQRGYYSDLINSGSERQQQQQQQQPAVSQKQIARARKGDSLLKKTGSLQHTPDPLTFSVPPPDEFSKLLDRQKYGPSTALLDKSHYAKRAWDPKVQVPYHVLSGQTPRKVEMERRRREYARHQIAELIEEQGEEPRRLVPNATASSKPRPGSWDFPIFLPLECFDDESFDPRTPQEWMELGIEETEETEGTEFSRKPIPGIALLPDLNPPPPPSRPRTAMQEESDFMSRPGSSRSLRSGARTPLDPIPLSQSSSRHSLISPLPVLEYPKLPEEEGPPYYEWAQVGVLDYCPDTKRYLVKRAVAPDSLTEQNGEQSSSSSDKTDTCTVNGLNGEEPEPRDISINGDIGSSAEANGNSHDPTGEDGIIESNVVNGEETKKSKSRRKRRSMRRVVTSVEDKGDHILYWIPRIHLLFSAEDPQLFSQRVVQAVQDRRLTEAHLRYHLYIDCMPCKEADCSLESTSLDKMSSWALNTPGLRDKDLLQESLHRLRRQTKLDHRRAMNRILFDETVCLHPNTFSYVCVPVREETATPERGKHSDVPSYPFKSQSQKFMFLTMMTSPEAVRALVCVKHECNRIHEMLLFNTSPTKPLKVEEFEQLQVQQCVQLQTYLVQDWSQKIVSSVLSCLRGHNKGAYNLEETQWDVYLVSKMRKLMNVIRFSMQDAIRYLIELSLDSFCEMVLTSVLSLSEMDTEFSWPNDIFNSPFIPLKGPVFLIELELHDEGPAYSNQLSDFERVLISCFDKGIDVTQAIPQLEKRIMERLFWKGSAPLLESVGCKEPLVCKRRDRISNAIIHSFVSLRAYAARYEEYMELHRLDINEYICGFMEEEKTAQQIKTEIDRHLKEKEVIDASIPANIIIGPFFVNTETIRGELIKKKKNIVRRLLTVLCSSLRNQCESICDEFKEVSNKIHSRPNSPEELMEQKEYLSSIPELLQERQSVIERAILGFNLLEEFYFDLSQDDFDTRWDVVAWPSRLVEEMEQAEDTLNKDDEHFRKNLTGDQNKLQDKLDELDSEISNFSAYQDISKAQDTAVRVRRIERSLKECQENCQLYQSRERLFGLSVTQYDKMSRLFREFEPFKNLWSSTAEWRNNQDTWMNNSLLDINPEELEQKVMFYFKTIHRCTKTFKDIKGCLEVAEEIKSEIEKFRPFIPLIQSLRNPGMRNRHWEQLSEQVNMVIKPKASLTFAKCLEMGLQNYINEITKIAEIASKEFSIEQALDKMEQEWEPQLLEIKAYKSTGTYIMRPGEDAGQLLDDHIVMTQSMSFSPYKKPFELRIASWENKLCITQDVIEDWQLCQRQWLYLEPIFSSEDINQQLPVESKRYQTMERMWRKIMDAAKKKPKVLKLCPDIKLLENLRECNKLLEQVQKGLSEYLETKRCAFPRFYFLSDEELLQILSQTKDPTAVQPHLRKCFENVAKLTFEQDLRMSEMWSGDGEKVPFCEALYPRGSVEFWMLEVERVMRSSVKDCIRRALEAYPSTPRPEWVLNWPGQVVIAGCQTFWTREATQALEKGNLDPYCDQLLAQLEELVKLVRGKLTRMQRTIMSALIVIEVHARDVVETMQGEGVRDVNAFEWISQLRYYWEDDTIMRAVNAMFSYGYEYLGNTGRLVITPLTDRCYLTLTGALHLRFGGAPAGPAGTGKTETVKDLAKAMAIQCVVFNCSDQLDFMAMGKFFKGLASAGAWACFDEFNRIDIEVLSVVAQQITTIQKAQMAKLDRFWFEGIELSLKRSCAVFVTMNPGYAGRTELPDNLKALFRPVAMMVPDYALIAQISLFSFGFSGAKVLSKKIVTTFKLSSEQLSSQDHYDFGMRAVKTVISAAGNLKREHPDMEEELILLRAIREANVPKFLRDDLKLFNGIVSDLFPHVRDEAVDYGNLEAQIRSCCLKQGLQDVDEFVVKCIQLYETTVVRHGLMLVGPTASAKTKCYEVLRAALTNLKGQMSSSGQPYEEVFTFVLNPKSITMGQLYGEFDALTHEWTDGLLSTLVRQGVAADTPDKKWFVFDGPVDTLWIESMNTVLDDNKKLCLTSGEIIKLTEEMTLMFEVMDLAVASPATVSRCGMVYLEPSLIGLSPFVTSWIQKNNKDKSLKHLHPFLPALSKLLDKFVQRSVDFVREKIKEIVPTPDANLVFSLLKMLECFFSPFIIVEGGVIIPEKVKMVEDLVEPWFIFSLIWSMGGTCGKDGRVKFDSYVREIMREEEGLKLLFPEAGLVYDYRLDDAGASVMVKSETEEDIAKDVKEGQIRWTTWMHDLPPTKIDPYMKFSDIIVPTQDTIRSNYLIELLLTNKKTVMCVGPTGTGKTLCAVDKLLRTMPNEYLSHILNFSAQTSANQTQDIIDNKLDKRRKGVFGPPLGKKYVFFIDDLNMPALEKFGAQPPIELVRQWMDHKGWYDRKAVGAFRNLVDVNFMCAIGPAGGGRNPTTPRLLRHFNFLSFPELEETSKATIFCSILGAWLGICTKLLLDKEALTVKLVNSTVSVYSTITSELLPTPAKSHYTFNLRDLSKVFQGVLMMQPHRMTSLPALLRLWYYECCRVFQDRLVDVEDRTWFNERMKKSITEFGVASEDVLTSERLFYGDFMVPNQDDKQYIEIEDHEKLSNILDEYLDDYNQINTPKMDLVLFSDAMQHVCRISRIIRQPLGNALLLGVGGSGRQSLTRLASHMAEYDCFQIELSKNYGLTEWREDVRTVLLKAGLENKASVFLFSDTQIKSESFLEDINNVLNSGDVPNIYSPDEQDRIYDVMKPVVLDAGQQATKANLFTAYTKRVRANIHMVICMSPIGEVFRSRLRKFPSLVNCCTIDWFSEWPDEALKSVAKTFLQDLPEFSSLDSTEGLVQVCVNIHQSVVQKSGDYMQQLNRQNHVTPTSYLELLGLFQTLISSKKNEIANGKNRTKTGLDKLLSTAEIVAGLQEELAEMKPQLEQAQIETEETLEQIQKDSVVANDTKAIVEKEEASASIKAAECETIKNDAQRDLDEALPALEQAVASLKALNRNDIVEIRAFANPPGGVKLVMETVCILQGVRPKKVAGDKPGSKIDDYWDGSRSLLVNPDKFLQSLYEFDKDNIAESIIQKINPYVENPDFTPTNIEKVSHACTSICLWVRAMHKYHNVAKSVAPKRAKLEQASAELEITKQELAKAMDKLKEVQDGIVILQAKYEECVTKKQDLAEKVDLCTQRLERAHKLIGGLADEKDRWGETVQRFDKLIENVIGDVLIASGAVAYLGSFTGNFRDSLVQTWKMRLTEQNIPYSATANLVNTLSDPVRIRQWQLSGLPRDSLSVENGVIVQYSRRWPLFIDPQGQANRWIKSLEKDKSLDVVKLTDRDFLRSLENAVRFGKPCLLENVGEELDPALDPILTRQTFKQAGSMVIKLGDNVIPYHDDFKLYITTKLPNPRYTPELATKVTVLNFTLSPRGLEDQLLGFVVAEERPDLEDAKNALIISNARMKQELKEIEDKILFKLSNSKGNPVDDIEMIDVLQASKTKSQEIQSKVAIAEQNEQAIDVTRSLYIPVSVRTRILFFCVNDLANIDPMYQYSLEWFLTIFLSSIAGAEKSDDLSERIFNINEYFTFSLYSNVCRSLFEKHKLLFSFLLSARILMNENKIDLNEWRFLISGGAVVTKEIPNPAPDWINERSWKEVLSIQSIEKFASFADEFVELTDQFKLIFDSTEPHKEQLPGRWSELSLFQKLLVLRCIRPDKVTNAMQDFVTEEIGQRFIEPQTSDLGVAFKDSSPVSPLIFVLSQGTDPAADLYKFTEEMKFTKKLSAISLGQGQGPIAEKMMKEGMERGKWVFFQNCHLAPSWMPSLERLIEQIESDKVHKDFRLWLTSMPSARFPVPILQNGCKMTIEPPRGIKANLLKSYTGMSDEFLCLCTKKTEFRLLLFSLCLFHGVTLERRKFGALGFNIPYEFTDGDLKICISQLQMFLDEYSDVPFKVLSYTAGHINYGGRVTDDWDRRCLMNILTDFYHKKVLTEEHKFDQSGIYHQMSPEVKLAAYLKYMKDLPINDTPEIFGLHENANITFAQSETFQLLDGIVLIQPKTSTGGGTSRETMIENMTKSILSKIPAPFPLKQVMEKYPVMYEESMNTVLVQEVIRYNRLIQTIIQTLKDLLKALKGLVVMSQQLEEMSISLFNNSVPKAWADKAYPSLKPLGAWVDDLVERVKFIQGWITDGIPIVFWFSGFFFPQAFLTGTLQNYARRTKISIDVISFDFQILKEGYIDITEKPENGCYIRGLYIEGARWSYGAQELAESRPKELYTEVPVICLKPMANRAFPDTGIYDCPLYKTLTRAGTLSTTGHSTNFVVSIELPTSKPQYHWIKRGVAMLCALDY